MKKLLLVALAVLSLVGTVQLADRALTPKDKRVFLADGSDPMPLCRGKKCPTPPITVNGQ